MAKKSKLSVFVLLDRSGSMSGVKWEKAIGSINEYVNTLKNEKVAAEVTVAAFDSHTSSSIAWGNGIRGGVQMAPAVAYNGLPPAGSNLSFDILRESVDLKNWNALSMTETSPRGGTPLYDATARLLNMADNLANEKSVILIMTDGEENESRTYTLPVIRDRINTCQKRGWEVIFLGAEFNADVIARNYGIAESKVINTSVADMGRSMQFYATASANYATMGNAIDTTVVRSSLKA